MKLGTELIILLTGTVVPNNFDTLALSKPRERKQQYIQAIMYYLENFKHKVVFVENSGCSLMPYFKNYPNGLEILTFTTKPLNRDSGKGYKELEILEYAFNNSKFIQNSSVIVKITGRLKVLNLNYISKSVIKDSRRHKKLIRSNIYK